MIDDDVLNMSSTSFTRDLSQDLLQSLSLNSGDQFYEADPKAAANHINEVHAMLVQEMKKRDVKIGALQGDKQKLKGLLRKAKSAIDNINQRYKSAQEQSS